MKTIYKSAIALFITTILFFHIESFAQIGINAGVDPVMLVEMLAGQDVEFDNVQYTGAPMAAGWFTSSEQANPGIGSGVFLTSGAGNIIPGPNESCSSGINNGNLGDAMLTAMAGFTTYDAAVLQFDIIPQSDTLKFDYIFGSEEYNDFVGSTYNDVFAILISGPNPQGGNYGNKNIAMVPGYPELPVTVNNVNNGYAPCNVVPTGPCTHCEYFNDNTGGEYLEYDAYTTVITARAAVVPYEAYHLKIAIADVIDHIYDSGLLLGGTCLPDFQSFGFLAENNPALSQDVAGVISNDTVFITVPQGTDVTDLVASFDMMMCTKAFVNGFQQISDSSHNDFTDPVIYMLQGSTTKNWTVIVDILTDIENMPLAKVKIYPNPAQGKFNISGIEGCEVKIKSALGCVVKDYGTIEQSVVTVSGLASGLYFVEIKNAAHFSTRKIVVR